MSTSGAIFGDAGHARDPAPASPWCAPPNAGRRCGRPSCGAARAARRARAWSSPRGCPAPSGRVRAVRCRRARTHVAPAESTTNDADPRQQRATLRVAEARGLTGRADPQPAAGRAVRTGPARGLRPGPGLGGRGLRRLGQGDDEVLVAVVPCDGRGRRGDDRDRVLDRGAPARVVGHRRRRSIDVRVDRFAIAIAHPPAPSSTITATDDRRVVDGRNRAASSAGPRRQVGEPGRQLTRAERAGGVRDRNHDRGGRGPRSAPRSRPRRAANRWRTDAGSHVPLPSRPRTRRSRQPASAEPRVPIARRLLRCRRSRPSAGPCEVGVQRGSAEREAERAQGGDHAKGSPR